MLTNNQNLFYLKYLPFLELIFFIFIVLFNFLSCSNNIDQIDYLIFHPQYKLALYCLIIAVLQEYAFSIELFSFN